jgi:hypothetical protein
LLRRLWISESGIGVDTPLAARGISGGSWPGFFLAGYRIFTRWRDESGRNPLGLKIIRRETDKHRMVTLGNLMTGYNYRQVHLKMERFGTDTRILTSLANGTTTLDITFDAEIPEAELPVLQLTSDSLVKKQCLLLESQTPHSQCPHLCYTSRVVSLAEFKKQTAGCQRVMGVRVFSTPMGVSPQNHGRDCWRTTIIAAHSGICGISSGG